MTSNTVMERPGGTGGSEDLTDAVAVLLVKTSIFGVHGSVAFAGNVGGLSNAC